MATKDKTNFCLSETHKHVRTVAKNIGIFIRELVDRADTHDDSKFEDPELSIFAENTEKLAKVEYGTKEYNELLKEVRPAIEHHYSKNRHHPEHWPEGVSDMTLIDLLEMLSDWKAAGERNKNGNIRNSIDVNTKRYKIGPQLRKILENTVREHFTE